MMKKLLFIIFTILSLTNCLKDRLNKYDIKAKNGAADTRIDVQELKVIKDDNGNGVVNVNETAYIQVLLKNEGPAYATEVSASCIPENTTAVWTGINNSTQVGGSYPISPSSINVVVQQYTNNLGVGYTLILKAGAVKTTENLKLKLHYNVRNVNGYNSWSTPTKLSKEIAISIPVY
jgi:hypothetical protein